MYLVFRFAGCTWSVGRIFASTAPNGYRASRDRWYALRGFNLGRWGVLMIQRRNLASEIGGRLFRKSS